MSSKFIRDIARSQFFFSGEDDDVWNFILKLKNFMRKFKMQEEEDFDLILSVTYKRCVKCFCMRFTSLKGENI